MPSIAGHMVVAKLVQENLKIESQEFIKGNLLPDIIKKKNSHHKRKGKYFLIPDLNYFQKHLDLTKPLQLGYYTHLLLDQYFLEEFIPKNISNLDVFQNKIIYDEYNQINYLLVKAFRLDVKYLIEILEDFPTDIKKNKLNYNLKCLQLTDVGETTYLKYKDFAKFLYEISKVISKEIEAYANQSN